MMNEEQITFNKLKKCPFCGNLVYYTKNYVYGSILINQPFTQEGESYVYNGEMYEGLNYKDGNRAYCEECNEYLGNLTTGKISVKALKALSAKEENKI